MSLNLCAKRGSPTLSTSFLQSSTQVPASPAFRALKERARRWVFVGRTTFVYGEVVDIKGGEGHRKGAGAGPAWAACGPGCVWNLSVPLGNLRHGTLYCGTLCRPESRGWTQALPTHSQLHLNFESSGECEQSCSPLCPPCTVHSCIRVTECGASMAGVSERCHVPCFTCTVVKGAVNFSGAQSPCPEVP